MRRGSSSLATCEDKHIPADEIGEKFAETRALTVLLCQTLQTEDYVVQAMPQVSPPRWHLAHTTWFFEKFVLIPYFAGYRPFNAGFDFLFNSYYESVGPFFEQARRGQLSRPTVKEIRRYREYVDDAVGELLRQASGWESAGVRALRCLVELGLHHEQQHQELLLTDVLFNFGANPLRPAYREGSSRSGAIETVRPLGWIEHPGGVVAIGNEGRNFAFDNEGPRHRVWLEPFKLADRLITQGEYLEFMQDGGYERPELWLSDGWRASRQNGWSAPLYWERQGESWRAMTLFGMQPLQPADPVHHVSFYEADAFARWKGRRLPREEEWEAVASRHQVTGNFLDSGALRPLPPRGGAQQFYGDVWQWTASPYTAYPGYQAPAGALGEYNGKFMCNQMVLRGGSCLSPASHIRATYRNFFPPEARWQVSGIRLGENVEE